MGYSFLLTARVLLYAPSHRQDSISDDSSHHERTLLPRSYISLLAEEETKAVEVVSKDTESETARTDIARPLMPTLPYQPRDASCISVERLAKRTGRKEGNVLFNDALNTFYLRLYDVIHMVNDHSDSKRGNPRLPHGLLFPVSNKGSFICIIPQTG